MIFFRGIIAAFATFSRIPMPHVNLSENDMKYCMAGFPLVGVVIGLVEYLMMNVIGVLGLGKMAGCIFLGMIPIIVTGGIHLDGFCDVTDANSSWQSRQRKLEILSDAHIGAFALIGCIVICGLYIAAISEINQNFLAFCATFTFSRALIGIFTIYTKPAKSVGMMALEHNLADKNINVMALVIMLVLSTLFMVWFGGVTGIISATFGLLTGIIKRRKAIKDFGGFTGDLAGCLLVNVELYMTIAIFVIERIELIWF